MKLFHLCCARRFFVCLRFCFGFTAVGYARVACILVFVCVVLRIPIFNGICPAQFLIIEWQSGGSIMLFGIVLQFCSC